MIASQGRLMSMELPEDRFSLSVDFAHCSSARTNPVTGCDLFSGWENCLQQVDLFQTLRNYNTVGIFHCLDVCEGCLHSLLNSPRVGYKSLWLLRNLIIHGVTVKFAACW